MSSRAELLRWVGVTLTLVLAAVWGEPAAAQLASEVAAVEDGRVRFLYATRPGVEICDDGVRRDGSGGWSRGSDTGACWTDGMARVELRIRSGVVRDVRLLRPRDLAAADAGREELNTVGATEAVEVLLAIARRGGDHDAAKEAVFPVVVADVPAIWRDLAALARDGAVDGPVREATLFWLGQEAAHAVTSELSDVALSEGEDVEVRKAAIFALSQRPHDEAMDALMEVGRSAADAESRRSAMFWLAQFDDPRVVSFFQDVLAGRS